MSRSYEMHLRVRGADPDQADTIKQAAAEQWPFEDWHAAEYPGRKRGRESFFRSLGLFPGQENGGAASMRRHKPPGRHPSAGQGFSILWPVFPPCNPGPIG